MIYIVESPIKMDGHYYEPGDEIELDKDQAAILPVQRKAAPLKKISKPKARSSNSRRAGK